MINWRTCKNCKHGIMSWHNSNRICKLNGKLLHPSYKQTCNDWKRKGNYESIDWAKARQKGIETLKRKRELGITQIMSKPSKRCNK